MAARNVYLAKYRTASNQRAHFALFFPNATDDRSNIRDTYPSQTTKGTIINVVGEPLMTGFVLEIKRNYDCSNANEPQPQQLVFLGQVDAGHLYEPQPDHFVNESIPRARLEHEAAKIPPPPSGQNIRAPVDGINTKRCQEWTMEYLRHLASLNLIDASAVDKAQAERDPADFGIFGLKPAGPSALE